MSMLNDLLTTLSSVSAYVVAIGVVGLFATMAAMLWVWRGHMLDELDE